MSFYVFAKTLAYVVARILFRICYEGLENIPKDQGFILASNHRSVFDPVFIAYKMPQKLHFMAKIELFRNRLFACVIRNLNAFPVDRGKGDGAALDEAKRRLESGGVLCVFIEGHRSEDGVPLRPRSGVSLIAGRTGADILPCAVVYSGKLRLRSTVTIRFGQLIQHGQLGIDLTSPATLRVAAKQVMDKIVVLLGANLPDAAGRRSIK